MRSSAKTSAIAILALCVGGLTGVPAQAAQTTTAAQSQSQSQSKPVSKSAIDCSTTPTLLNGDFDKEFDKTWYQGSTPDTGWMLAYGYSANWQVSGSGLLNLTRDLYAPASSGDQSVQLNSFSGKPEDIRQNIRTTPGTTLHWSIDHRGLQGDDTMSVLIGTPGGEMVQQGPDRTATSSKWETHSGNYLVPAGQEVTTIVFRSVSPLRQSNLLDNAVLVDARCPSPPQAYDSVKAFPNATIKVAPPTYTGGSPITGYEYQVDGGPWISSPTPNISLSGLSSEVHEFMVRAVTANGPGPASITYPFGPQGVPGAPGTWEDTRKTEEIVLGGYFQTEPASLTDMEYQIEGQGWVSLNSTQSPFRITGLTPGTEYRIRLRGVNEFGAGYPSDWEVTSTKALPDYPSRFSAKTRGNVKLIGNTLMTCPDSNAFCAGAQQGDKMQNNSFRMVPVDIDGDPTTKSSSSADLKLEDGSEVLWAGLYWGGEPPTLPPVNPDKIKVKGPGQSDYTNVTGDKLYAPAGQWVYSAYADVTNLVRQRGSGTYTVGAVLTENSSRGAFAGWGMVVAYANPDDPIRAIDVYDGFAEITQSIPVRIDVSGLKTPQSGQTNLGVIALEGDLGFDGDYFQMQNPVGEWEPLSNETHQANDFFNSTITDIDGHLTDKNPNYVNQLGYDVAVIDVSDQLPAGSTRASFRADSEGDNYYPQALTFVSDLYSPDLVSTKSVTDLNGGTAQPGDKLRYDLTVANKNGSRIDTSEGNRVIDELPQGVNFVPGSVKVNGTAVADSGDVVTINGQTLTVRIGSGADSTEGGDLDPGDNVRITFEVAIDSSVADGAELDNSFETKGTAKEGQFEVTAPSNETKVVVDVPKADLSITKTTDATSYAGLGVNYQLDVANDGPDASTRVEVTDTINAPAEFVSAVGEGWTCAFTTPTLTCHHGPLASGDSAEPIDVRLRLPADATPGTLANTADVSAYVIDPDLSNNSSSVNTTIVAAADLSIEATRVAGNSDGSTYAGHTNVITLEVKNEGPAVARDVEVTHLLSGPFTVVSASGDGWTCDKTVKCTLDDPLDPEASAESITIVVAVDGSADGTYPTQATVGSSTVDLVPSNNSADVDVDVTLAVDLIAALTHAADVVPGSSLRMTGSSTNAGPGTLPVGTKLTHSITLPDGVTYDQVIGSDWTCQGQLLDRAVKADTITCHHTLTAALQPGGSAPKLEFDVLVDGTVTPGAGLQATTELTANAGVELDESNNSDVDFLTPTVRPIDLALGVTGASGPATAGGDPVKVTLDLTNAGANPAAGPYEVRFLAPPTGVTAQPVAGSAWTCATDAGFVTCTHPASTLVTSAALPSLELEVSAAANVPPSTWQVQAVASSSNEEESEAELANNVARTTVSFVTSAVLEVTKTVDKSSVSSGQSMTYTITLKNNGPSVARNVTLLDVLPTGAVVNGSDGTGLTCVTTTDRMICEADQLNPGVTKTVTITAKTNAGIQTANTELTNTASATHSTGDPAEDSVKVTISPESEINTVKSIIGDVPERGLVPGSTVTYEVKASNFGPSATKQLTMVDTLPSSLEYIAASGDGWSCSESSGTVTCTHAGIVLNDEEAEPVTITALLAADAQGMVVNTARVDPPAGTGTGVDSSAEAAIQDFTDLVVQPNSPATVAVGQQWTTDYVVRNIHVGRETGPITLVVKVEGALVSSAQGTGWDCIVGSESVRCSHPGPLDAAGVLPALRVTGDPDPRSSAVTTTVRVEGNDPEGNYDNNEESTTTAILNQADVSATVGKPRMSRGGNVSYTATFRNAGPSDATGGKLRMGIPQGGKFLAAKSDKRCSVEGSSVVCYVGRPIAPRDSEGFDVKFKVPATATNLRVQAHASSMADDPNSDNDDDEAPLQVAKRKQTPKTKPARSLSAGTNTLYRKAPMTNANQRAKVAVLCQPLARAVGRSDSQVQGDLRYCRTVRKAGAIRIQIAPNYAVRVTVRVTAPATASHLAMRKTYNYVVR